MSYSELRLTLPKDARVHLLAYAIWAAGVTPWSWAWQAGPDFLPLHSAEQLAGWWAYEAQQERERRREHDEALAREVARAQAILAEQGMVLADGPIPVDEEPHRAAWSDTGGFEPSVDKEPQP